MANVCKPLLSRKGFPPLTDLQPFKFRRISRAARPEDNVFFSEQWNTNIRIGSYDYSGIQRTWARGSREVMSDSGKKRPGLSQFDQVSGTW